MISELYAVYAGISALLIWLGIALKTKQSKLNVIIVSAFILYMTGVISLTLFPINFEEERLRVTNTIENRIQLIPFKVISETFKFGLPSTIIVQLGGNILMTIPFGFLFPMIAKNKKTVFYILAFLALPIVIETSQLLIGLLFGVLYRTTDIDDVILNFSGAMIGYGFYVLFIKKLKLLKKYENTGMQT